MKIWLMWAVVVHWEAWFLRVVVTGLVNNVHIDSASSGVVLYYCCYYCCCYNLILVLSGVAASGGGYNHIIPSKNKLYS